MPHKHPFEAKLTFSDISRTRETNQTTKSKIEKQKQNKTDILSIGSQNAIGLQRVLTERFSYDYQKTNTKSNHSDQSQLVQTDQ